MTLVLLDTETANGLPILLTEEMAIFPMVLTEISPLLLVRPHVGFPSFLHYVAQLLIRQKVPRLVCALAHRTAAWPSEVAH